ncbi:MAG: glycosyltransferase [Ruminococcaceae bacterium]|nr:glycosyltransferase [Oscillospiraceae bacterium]
MFRKVEVERPKELAGKFVILMIGRLSREKRQDLLIEAVKRSKYADKIHLVFAGKGPTHGKYQRMARRLPGGAEFRFFSQEALLRQINMSDLYVHASDAEIEGISCLEAMACGLVPVISNSRLSATGQYALHPNSLFEAGDVADLAAKIDYWIEHPEEKAALSEAYQRQQDDNRVDICARQMEELYQQVIDTTVNKPFEALPLSGWRKLLAPRPERVNSTVFSQKRWPVRLSGFFATNIVRLLLPFHKLFLGLLVTGKENLRHLQKGAISISNHIHMMDCTMTKLPFLSRKFWIISLRENFEMPVVGWLVKLLGAVSLGTSHRDQGALHRKLMERIDAGDIVHYYPEGMLVPYHKGLRAFHNGAFALAVRAGCQVVPMVLCTSRRGGLYRLKKKPCLTLRILKPIEPEPDLAPKYARMVLQKQVEVAMQREFDNHTRELKTKAWPVFQEQYDAEYADMAYEDESA